MSIIILMSIVQERRRSGQRSTKEQPYADVLRSAMRKRGLTIRGLAEATHYSYEHLRKLLSVASPVQSPACNAALCQCLGLDPKQMWRLASTEKLRRRYGQIPPEVQPPPDTRVSDLWHVLNDDDRNRVAAVVEALATKAFAERQAFDYARELAQVAPLSAIMKRSDEREVDHSNASVRDTSGPPKPAVKQPVQRHRARSRAREGH